jgi:tetratricopeptide (TPR) repeat protein
VAINDAYADDPEAVAEPSAFFHKNIELDRVVMACVNDGTGEHRLLHVAVIGNSNSIMQTSFTAALARRPDIVLRNWSIGSTPSVLLLDVLARQTDWDLDFIIIEIAVIDTIHTSDGRYTTLHTFEALEIFLIALRARCAARIVVLILPTRYGLLRQGRDAIEHVYGDFAARHGLAVLNACEIVRGLFGRRAMKRARCLLPRYQALAEAFGIAGVPAESLAWRALRDPYKSRNAFAYYGMVDHIHISLQFHTLIAELLHDHMRRSANDPGHQTVSADKTLDDSRVLVTDAEPSGAQTMIERRSTLLGRWFACLNDGDTITYAVPPGHKAVGLLLNQSQTFGFLRIASETGTEILDVRGPPQRHELIAVIMPILTRIAGNAVSITLLPSPPDAAPFSGNTNHLGSVKAELAELVLVQESWQPDRPSSAPRPDNAAAIVIEAQPWARQRIADTAEQANLSLDGVDAGGTWLERDLAAQLIRESEDLASVPPAAMTARLLLLGSTEDRLAAYLDEACVRQPADAMLQSMRHALLAVRPSYATDFTAMLGAFRRARDEGRKEEAEKIALEGELWFPQRLDFSLEYVWILHARRDWDAALEQWAQVREDFPLHPAGYSGAAITYAAFDRLEDAEAVLRLGQEILPENPDIVNTLGHILTLRADAAKLTSASETLAQTHPPASGS